MLKFTSPFAMWQVARQYQLPLRSVTHLAMPLSGMADRMGECTGAGDIRLVLRCTVEGEWCDAPLSPKEVWDTAAHELAHLRHMNHGDAFKELMAEMAEALSNRQEDHRDKVLKRLVKLQASREGEAAIGNAAAAEAFATMINRMLVEYELSPSDIDYAKAQDHDPVIEVMVNLGAYKIRVQKARIAWQESLARVVARAHLCSFLLRTGSNHIWFVGTKSHATVAEYAYGTLVPIIDKLSDVEYYAYLGKCQREGRSKDAHGYRPAWLQAFVRRIEERFFEARAASVSSAPSESQALIRLNGALAKTQKYIEDKFSSRGTAAAVGKNSYHSVGREHGRAAADRVALGRRGVNGVVPTSKKIGDGR
jgi:hypothetical protein